MIRSARLLVSALLAITATNVFAAEVTVAYKGLVTSAQGPQASSFAAGQEISVRYVLEATTADSNPNASAGVFYNGLRTLTIKIPAAGVDASTAFGTVQTFNDVLTPDPSDQVFFYGPATSGTLAGLNLTELRTDFTEFNFGGTAYPLMLVNDSIPISPLYPQYSTAIFYTVAGYTTVFFLAEADVPIPTCASEGFTGTKLAWCQNICESDLTGAALNTWIHRWIARYRTMPACALPTPVG